HKIKEIGVVYLTDIRFVAARIPGDLDMPDQGEMRLELPRQIAAHDLAVIEVELQKQIWMSDSLDDSPCLVRQSEEVAGHVDHVDRLDDERDPPLGGLLSRPGEVLDEPPPPRRRPGTRHAMELAAAIGLGIAEGLAEGSMEVRLSSGQRAKSALARVP